MSDVYTKKEEPQKGSSLVDGVQIWNFFLLL